MVNTREVNKEFRNKAWISTKTSILIQMRRKRQDKILRARRTRSCLALRALIKKFNLTFKNPSRSSRSKQLKVTTVRRPLLLMCQCLEINKSQLLVTKYLPISIKEVRMHYRLTFIMTNGLDSKISWNSPNERNLKTDWKSLIRHLTVITLMRVR